MKIFRSKKKLKKILINQNKLGFVPTMGAIHAGHISLIKKSIYECEKTIVSIFVNKPQFNNRIDFKNYPKILNKDLMILKKLKINYLYLPIHKEIYPNGPNKKIKIDSLEKKLCGKFRPGHFKAVVDVINRFIKIIEPAKIYMGEKDMQQLKIVTHFVKQNYTGTDIISCKTVREKNGIAYSSRNFLLTNKEKKTASNIYKYLKQSKKKIIGKKIMLNSVKNKLHKFGVKKIDYVKVLDINKLINPIKYKKKYRIFIAYYLRHIRLIDNI